MGLADSKTAADVIGDPNWQITTGEENLRSDKEIILLGEKEDEEEDQPVLKLGPTLLTDASIEKAKATERDKGEWVIGFTLDEEGTRLFADITSENTNKQLAIVFNYRVLSAPNIRENITDGKAEISGNFKKGEAKDLETTLNDRQ